MKYYDSSHAAFFEAAFADWPTIVVEWLAEDIPPITELVPHNSGGMLIKDSPEWIEIQYETTPELLPDWCFNCGYIDSYLPGGKIREGCHRCVDQLDPNADAYMTALMRTALVLTAQPEPHYTEQLTDYLILCHVKWREQSLYPELAIAADADYKPERTSLRDKLKP